MKVLNRRCAGLDVHKDEVVACVRLAMRGGPNHEVQRFATTTRGLLALADWLEASGVTHVAMEATGVYWKPVWHMLEERFQLVLANAAHVRNVPGRKSDVNDATWIADLMAHGLIRASFVPPAPIQELRDLTRTRKQLGREIVQHTQRIQKVLEDANIKLSSLISDVLGASGRRILKALIQGESAAGALAALGGSRLKCSRQELKDALDGRITPHHRFLVGQHLRMIEELEVAVAAFDARIEAALAPFRDAAERLTSLPGISDIAAQTILAEIGPDMSAFPAAGHLLSWAGLTPRLDESAGKRRSTRSRKARRGSSPYSCSAPLQQRGPRIPTCRHSSCASRRGGDRKRLPSRWPRRSLRPSTICCAMAPSTTTSGHSTSLATTRPVPPCASSAASRTSGMTSKSKSLPDLPNPHQRPSSFWVGEECAKC